MNTNGQTPPTAKPLAPASGSDFRGYKHIDFRVFWNAHNKIAIQQGMRIIEIHPGVIGHLYGLMKDERERMESEGLDWRKV